MRKHISFLEICYRNENNRLSLFETPYLGLLKLNKLPGRDQIIYGNPLFEQLAPDVYIILNDAPKFDTRLLIFNWEISAENLLCL